MASYWWDLTGRQRLLPKRLPVGEGKLGKVTSVAFSPNGKTLAAGYEDRDGVLLWDLTERERLLPNACPAWKGSVTSVAFSPTP